MSNDLGKKETSLIMALSAGNYRNKFTALQGTMQVQRLNTFLFFV